MQVEKRGIDVSSKNLLPKWARFSSANAIVISAVILFSMFSPALAGTQDNGSTPLKDGSSPMLPQGTIDFNSLTRDKEPVVVDASLVPTLAGTPVNNTDVKSPDNDILVYIWNGTTSTWWQIPFQVDERNNVNGSYIFGAVNGVLDTNDEIVFMSGDLGDQPTANEWVVGCDGPRYEIQVDNPLNPGERGWAYVYRSLNNRVEATFTQDYMNFDTTLNDISSDDYTMGFVTNRGMIMDYLNVTPAGGGDGIDLVDRMELEMYGVPYVFGFPQWALAVEFTENDMYEDFTLKKDGYVRAMGSSFFYYYDLQAGITVEASLTLDWKFYPETINVTGELMLNIADLGFLGDVRILNLNMSLDHQSAICLPFADYRDSFGNFLPIDGNPNPVANGLQRWWEVSSPHGGYVCVWDMTSFNTVGHTLRFEDDSTIPEAGGPGKPDHTGAEDGRYGNSGDEMGELADVQTSPFYLQLYPLSGIEFNEGANKEAMVDNPLQISSTVHNSPTIWVGKVVDNPTPSELDTITYTIYYNNTGNEISPIVWINDTLPTGVTFVGSVPPPSSIIGQDLSWNFLNVEPGINSITITVTVDIGTVGQRLTNWVYCNFTNQFGEWMPESIASAAIQVQAYTHSIPLMVGWNLISFPTQLTNETIDAVLNSITGNWDIVMVYNTTDSYPWKSHNIYRPSQLNDVDILNNSLGFWINITESGVIFNTSGSVPISTSIPLYTGWNLVGYPSLVERSISLALAGTGYDAVDGFNQTAPYRISPLAGAYMMKPGEGYWVHVPSDTTWLVNW